MTRGRTGKRYASRPLRAQLSPAAEVGAQVIGCRQPEAIATIAIPFFVNVREDTPGEFDLFRISFYPGLWRPEAVTVSLSNQPAFVETFRALAFDWTCRTAMSWDGGNRIAVNALLEGMVREVDAGPDYELNCVDPPSDGLFVTLSAPSESEEGTSSDSGEGPLLVAYSTGAEGPGVVVGIRRGDGLAKTALQLPAGDWEPHSIVRPMFVGPEGQDVLVLVLAERKTGEGATAQSVGAQSLLICRLGADGRQDWTEVDTTPWIWPRPPSVRCELSTILWTNSTPHHGERIRFACMSAPMRPTCLCMSTATRWSDVSWPSLGIIWPDDFSLRLEASRP